MPTSTDDQPALAVVVVGMSAGGLGALKTILRTLPTGFPGAVVLAYHVAAPSHLPDLIRIWTEHDCRIASAGESLQRGVIYVAPEGHHVVINPDATLGLSARGRVRFVRPSADWLFESAAASFEDRAIAVVLSGANADGSFGVRCIARAGGQVVVQEPGSCEYPRMPDSAIATGVIHRSLHPREIGGVLIANLSKVYDQLIQDWPSFDDEASGPGSVREALLAEVS